MMTFEIALERWEQAERERVEAQTAYDQTYAQALILADGKSAEIRKAQAELASVEALRALGLAAAEAKTYEHWVIHLRRDAA